MRLNQRIVDGLTLPPGKRDYVAWDDEVPGLGVRIQGEKRTWICRFRVRGLGSQRQVTLGPVAALKLKDAREAAGQYIAGAKKGTDVAAAEREAAATARLAAEVVSTRRLDAIVTRYKVHAAKTLRPSTVREVVRYLDRHWKPLHDHIADELDRRTIVARLEEIAAESGPIAANRGKAYLSAAIAWGVERGLLSQNPCMGVPTIGKETRRDRTLTDQEVRTLWQALPGGDFGDILKLLLLLGQRRSEVADMAWSELDFDKAEWVIPAERSKNHKPHSVPLPEAALAILKGRRRRPDRSYVFGVGRRGGFSGFGACKGRLDKATGLPPWVVHDLRRTAATGLQRLGIRLEVTEALLNHVSGSRGGIVGVYQRYGFETEKRAAIEAWAAHLLGVVEGREPASKVVPLRATIG